jgi:hypothetical protein
MLDAQQAHASFNESTSTDKQVAIPPDDININARRPTRSINNIAPMVQTRLTAPTTTLAPIAADADALLRHRPSIGLSRN